MFANVDKKPVPADSLLGAYAAREGVFTDCYTTVIDRSVTIEEFVEAFYCTPLFKIERIILAAAMSRPSTDVQAAAMASGDRERFSAWQVEGRAANEILLADVSGATRSWLMVEPAAGYTTLLFGSAVINPGSSPLFSALMIFHKIYARSLIAAARASLAKA